MCGRLKEGPRNFELMVNVNRGEKFRAPYRPGVQIFYSGAKIHMF